MNDELLAFLAIVADEDLRRGVIEPSYILCKQKEGSARTGYIVIKGDNPWLERIPKVLVSDLSQHDELIHFMSNYRAREYNNRHRKDGFRKKYHPKGALFWFPCDIYGVQDRSQAPVFIKHVPDKSFPTDGTKQILEQELEAKDCDMWRLTHETAQIEMPPIVKRKY